jgi:hypothetical protein
MSSPEKEDPTSNVSEDAHLLYHLAHSAVAADDPKQQEKMHMDMSNLIMDHLDNGDEEILRAALDLAVRAGDKEAELELVHSYENIATNSTIFPAVPGSKEPTRNVSLFLIPVIVFTPARLTSGRFAADDNFNRLKDSIKKHGIAQSDDTVFLLDYLYHADEIKRMGYSDVYDLHVSITTAALTDIDIDPASYRQVGWPEPASDAIEELRYLVGVIVGRNDVDPFEAATDTVAEMVREAKMEPWKKEASILVSQMLGIPAADDNVSVESIDPFFVGFRISLTGFKYLAIDRWIAHTLEESGIEPLAINAIVAPYGNNGATETVRISLASALDHKLIAGHEYVYDEYDDLDSLLMSIYQLLNMEGIATIDIMTDSLPDKDAQGNKTPFLTNAAELDAWQDIGGSGGGRTLH